MDHASSACSFLTLNYDQDYKAASESWQGALVFENTFS